MNEEIIDNTCLTTDKDEVEISTKEPEELVESKTSQELSDLKEIIDKHFSTIAGLVRYSKTKDANVLTLSKQLQEYRDGFAKNVYKRIALELISFREECKKSHKELEQQELKAETARKYIGFLCDDYYDLMENIGLSQKDGTFLYNGKSLNGELIPFEIKDPRDDIEIQCNEQPIEDLSGLLMYLQTTENNIVALLKNNTALDTLVSNYIKKDSIYEEGLYQIILYPTLRKIVALYEELQTSNNMAVGADSEEGISLMYENALNKTIDSLENILFLLDVSIDKQVHDFYDPKIHRILKTIFTDESNLNERISIQYTDCYIMDEKTIYPAKVDVYKTK